MTCLAAACKQIMGQQTLEDLARNGLSASQVSQAAGMLRDGWDPGTVDRALTVLQRYPWFAMIGIRVPPWEITDEHWDRLMEARPWESRRGQAHVPERWREVHGRVQLSLAPEGALP